MGPVNWLAVLIAAAAAWGVAKIWASLLAGTGPRRVGDAFPPGGDDLVAGVVFLVAAAMLGHALARIGPETLAAKPWLYFMQAGGLAIAFVIPAVWLTNRRLGVAPSRGLRDCGLWLVAYLAMGAVFLALG